MLNIFLNSKDEKISRNRQLYYPEAEITDITGIIYKQDNTFFKWAIGYGDDTNVITDIKNIITSPDYLTQTNNPIKITDVVDSYNKYSVIKIIFKKELLRKISLSNTANDSRIKRLSSRVTNSNQDESKIKFNFDKLLDETSNFIKDKIMSYIDNLFVDKIISLQVYTNIYDKETKEMISVDDFFDRIRPEINDLKSKLGITLKNSSGEEDEEGNLLPSDYVKLSKNLSNEPNIVNRYEEEAVVEMILKQRVINEIEAKNAITFKMDRLQNLISKDLTKVNVFSALMDDSSIQCENLLNVIKQKVWEMTFSASYAFVDLQYDPDPHDLIDKLIVSNEIVFKQEFNKHLEEIGYGFCNQKLTIGSSLSVRVIFLPNFTLDTKVINLEKINLDGKYYVVLERHISETDVRTKVFHGTFTELMIKIPDFIKDHEKVLVTDHIMYTASEEE